MRCNRLIRPNLLSRFEMLIRVKLLIILNLLIRRYLFVRYTLLINSDMLVSASAMDSIIILIRGKLRNKLIRVNLPITGGLLIRDDLFRENFMSSTDFFLKILFIYISGFSANLPRTSVFSVNIFSNVNFVNAMFFNIKIILDATFCLKTNFFFGTKCIFGVSLLGAFFLYFNTSLTHRASLLFGGHEFFQVTHTAIFGWVSCKLSHFKPLHNAITVHRYVTNVQM